jgi:transglutaminase-like putative cysteine protease
MPWSVTAAVGVSFIAFTLAAGVKPLLLLFAALIAFSHFSSFRLGDSMGRWWVRLALLMLAVTFQMGDDQPQGMMIGAARGRNVLALAAAAEIVMQYWRHRPRDPHWGPLAALLFSGFLLLAATNTTLEIGLIVLTPLYFGLALASFRNLRPRPSGTGRWATALMAVMLVGGISAGYVAQRRSALMDLGLSWLFSRMAAYEGATGRDAPQLGPLFEQRGSPARVLEIDGYDGGHLRGGSYVDYDRGGWSPPNSMRRFKPVGSNTLAIPVPRGLVPKEASVVRFSRSPLVYAPLATLGFDLLDAATPELAEEEDGPVRASERPPYTYRFRYIDGLPGKDFQGVLASPLKPVMRKRCLLVPQVLRPALTSVAKVAARGATEPEEVVANVTAYLLKNHRYSLRWRPSGERLDPTVEFLVKKQDAHCEFFASAATLLLRIQGVPARYVTGFFAHEKSEGGLTVRQRDAHAWCEAWIDGVGWVTVEATPPSGLPDASKEKAVEPWRRVLEWFQNRWVALGDWLATVTMETILLFFGGAVVLVGGYFAGRFLLERRSGPPPDDAWRTPPAHLAPLASRFEAVLKRHSATFEPARPWSESLETLPEALRGPARRFVELYATARFGARFDRAALEAALKALEAMAQKK